MLTKAQAVFDAAVPANGDATAAYLFASNRLTSTTIGGSEALDVKSFLADGAGTALTSTTVGGVQALDVNIAAFSATGFMVEGNIADGAADAGSDPVKIGSRVISGVLGAATAGNRADGLSDLYRRILTSDAPSVANKHGVTTVGVAAVKIVTTNLAGRTRFLAQNNSAHPIYIGADNTVTADSSATGGLLIPGHGGTLELPSGDSLDWYAISDTAAQKLVVVELG